MKKFAYLLMLPLALLFTQCENGGGEEDIPEETVDLGNVVEVDLNEYGYPLVISLPKAGDQEFEPIIDVLDWGALEIRVGVGFAVQISGGDGNMAQVKEDISLDDVYAATYLVDDPDAILYGWAIKDTEMEPGYRFYVIKMDGDNAWEIRSIDDGDAFTEGPATRMFNIAKAVQIQPAS